MDTADQIDPVVKFNQLAKEYSQADTEWENAKRVLEEKTLLRSKSCEAIANLVAPEKEVVINGNKLTIVVRENTFFFRGAKKSKSKFVAEI